MKDKLRPIQVYSSSSDERIDYRLKYWFHHWLDKNIALIEDEEGELLEINYKNFKFKNERD